MPSGDHDGECMWTVTDPDHRNESYPCTRTPKWRITFTSGLYKGHTFKLCGVCRGAMKRSMNHAQRMDRPFTTWSEQIIGESADAE